MMIESIIFEPGRMIRVQMAEREKLDRIDVQVKARGTRPFGQYLANRVRAVDQNPGVFGPDRHASRVIPSGKRVADTKWDHPKVLHRRSQCAGELDLWSSIQPDLLTDQGFPA